MLVFHEQVFDETISGTSTTWYTADQHNGLFGAADFFSVFAVATDAVGTVQINFDESADNQHWFTTTFQFGLSVGGNLVDAAPLNNPPALPFGRLRVTLSGTNPTCRLKLTVTGRTL
jgi:hypothetical protein